MSLLTTNYEFIKPELTDSADITATNPNWDLLDELIKTLATGLSEAGSEMSVLNVAFSKLNEDLTQNISNSIATCQTKIKYGTGEPSGGKSGDVYIQLL